MGIFDFLRKLKVQSVFTSSSDKKTAEAIFQQLLVYVADRQLAKQLETKIKKNEEFSGSLREAGRIKLYFSIEKQIAKNKDELRFEISRNLNLTSLSPHFRLIFLPKLDQLSLLYEISWTPLFHKLEMMLGKQQISLFIKNQTPVFELDLDKFQFTGHFSDKLQQSQRVSSFFNTLYEYLVSHFGEEKTQSLFSSILDQLKSVYELYFIVEILEVWPTDLVSQIGYSYLTHSELEKEIAKRTYELNATKEKLEDKILEFTKSNNELEETKRAMLNLLEDSRVLEEELKQERDRMQLVVSSMGEGLLVIDKEFKVTMINQVAQKLLEVTAAETVGKLWSDIVTTLKDKEQTDVTERSFSRAIMEKAVIVTQIVDNHHYKTRSGKIFPVVSITAPLILNDQVIGAVKVFHDATAEKESRNIIEHEVAERTKQLKAARDKISEGWLTLQKEKARLTASLFSLSLGFIMTDRDENIVLVNPVIKKLFGIADGVTNLKELEKQLGGSIKLHELHEKASISGKSVDMTDMAYENKFLHLFISPIMLNENEVIGTVIVVEDETEAKNLERSRDEFFSIASHELRTPLTAIRGNTSLIQQYFSKEIKNKDLKEMVDDIHSASIRLIEIVNDFLDTSRLEMGKIQFKKSTVDLVGLVTEIVKELHPNGDKRLSLTLETDLPNAFVLADPDRVKQVLVNLIGNGLKFTEKGGVAMGIVNAGNQFEVQVTDTGRGIDEELQELLFKKFQQATKDIYSRDYTRGTGLGLYISKLLVEQMGGRIWLEKTSSSGSTFSFTLPKATSK